jgi:peptidoglycan/xylan/chitin deacetylase (PgdA/CDA1 family)
MPENRPRGTESQPGIGGSPDCYKCFLLTARVDLITVFHMKPYRLTTLICLAAILLAPGIERTAGPEAAPVSRGGKICITFDDLPMVRVPDRDERRAITDRILAALDEFNVEAAGFVIGDNIEDDVDLLRSWLEAGHVLGNHTYSHADLNEVPADLYIRDIKKGQDAIEDVLVELRQAGRYFRYPFLHYGNTYDTKKKVADYLEKEGYAVAHVTVDPEDFAYNLQYEKIYQSADSIDFVQLGNEYIDHIMDCLHEAEKLAQDVMGRKIKHIVLLHANRINGAFLSDLLSELSAEGYTFISLDEALADPVYSIPETYAGPQGLSYLERLEKTDPDLLPARER